MKNEKEILRVNYGLQENMHDISKFQRTLIDVRKYAGSIPLHFERLGKRLQLIQRIHK